MLYTYSSLSFYYSFVNLHMKSSLRNFMLYELKILHIHKFQGTMEMVLVLVLVGMVAGTDVNMAVGTVVGMVVGNMGTVLVMYMMAYNYMAYFVVFRMVNCDYSNLKVLTTKDNS